MRRCGMYGGGSPGGEPGGGTVQPYYLLYEQLLPALREAGFTDAEIRQLTVENPRAAFTVRRRLSS